MNSTKNELFYHFIIVYEDIVVFHYNVIESNIRRKKKARGEKKEEARTTELANKIKTKTKAHIPILQ